MFLIGGVLSPPAKFGVSQGKIFTRSLHEGDVFIMGMKGADFLIQKGRLQGKVVQRVCEGYVDVEATNMAWQMMHDANLEAAMRSMLHQERWTMTNVEMSVKAARGESVTKSMLKACGTLKHMCPFCCEVGNVPKHDSRCHGRFECKLQGQQGGHYRQGDRNDKCARANAFTQLMTTCMRSERVAVLIETNKRE